MVISPGVQLEIPNEGMPVRNFPSERGSVLIRFDVEFPSKLTASQISGLLGALPDRLPEPSDTKDATKVNLQAVDKENYDKEEYAEGRYGKQAFDSSSDEGQGGGVACSQQ